MRRPRRPLAVVRALVVVLTVLLGLTACGAGSAPRSTAVVPTVVKAGSSALFFGDSWTSGYGVQSGESFAYRAAKALMWDAIVAGQPGSGYLAHLTKQASTFPVRASELTAEPGVGVVVLQGGINDADLSSLGGLRSAVDSTLASLERVYPGTPIIVLGPSSYTATTTPELQQVSDTIEASAKAAGVPFISPIAEHWINETNVSVVIDPSNAHPTVAGHVYIAERLVNDIRALEQAGRLTSPRD